MLSTVTLFYGMLGGNDGGSSEFGGGGASGLFSGSANAHAFVYELREFYNRSVFQR